MSQVYGSSEKKNLARDRRLIARISMRLRSPQLRFIGEVFITGRRSAVKF